VPEAADIAIASRGRTRVLLPALLLALTALTTTAMGAAMAGPHGVLDNPFGIYPRIARHPRLLFDGLTFSVPLLGILLAHELGHYLACRRRCLQATLPYFLPAPTLVGTFGAFIRIRSPLTGRRDLMEVAAGGPLLGFLVCLPVLVLGVAGCRNVAVDPEWTGVLLGPDGVVFGAPLLMKALLWFRFGSMEPGAAVQLGPVALAGWFGLLITAMNLFPAGQLDGGHVVYALAPRRHRWVSWGVLVAVLLMGAFLWVGWLVWGIVLAVMGPRHPAVADPAPPPGTHVTAGWLCLVLFVLCLTPVPILI
jgi:membrane-associated protease RseP (regulator of RpoE activity)